MNVSAVYCSLCKWMQATHVIPRYQANDFYLKQNPVALHAKLLISGLAAENSQLQSRSARSEARTRFDRCVLPDSLGANLPERRSALSEHQAFNGYNRYD